MNLQIKFKIVSFPEFTKRDNNNYISNNIEHILESSYHGLIKENETFVEIRPLIKVDSTKVCDFHLIKKGNHDLPFKIELVNNLGVLQATKTLNCEKHINYRFEIAAVMCDGTHSKRYVRSSIVYRFIGICV